MTQYCPTRGGQKARVLATPPGGKLPARHFREADAIRAAAKKYGLRASIHRIARGKPEHEVTILGSRKGGAA